MSTHRELAPPTILMHSAEESLLEGMYGLSKTQEKEFNSVINRKLLFFHLPFLEEAFAKYFNENIYKTQIEIWMILLIELSSAIIGSFFIGFNFSQVSNRMLISFITCKIASVVLEFVTIFHSKVKIIDFLADYILFLAIYLGNIGICHFSNFSSKLEFGVILGIISFGIGVQYIFAIHSRSKKFLPSLISFTLSYVLFAITSNIDMLMPNSSNYLLIKFIGLFVFGGVCIIFMYNTHINKRRVFFYLYLLFIDLKNQKEILDNIPIPIVISNENNISYINKNSSELIRTNTLESFQDKCSRIKCNDKDNLNKIVLTNFLKEEIDEKRTNNVILDMDSEERNIEITRIPIKYKGVKSIISAFKDLTEVLKEEKLKLQKKFELLIVGSMTHNFRTPLNCILATSEIIRTLITEPNITLKKYILKINQQARMLFDQVDIIHEYFNFKNGNLVRREEIFDPKEVILSVIDLYQDELEERKITIKLYLEDLVITSFKNDKSKYRQILVAIISNAIKYTNKGKISVTINYSIKESLLSTCIEDTGIGMSSNTLKQVQNSTLKIDMIKNQEYENFGLGIGIPLSNSLCKIMGGGQLEISSQENCGTKVCFNLINFCKRLSSQYKIYEEKGTRSIEIFPAEKIFENSHSELASPIKLNLKPQKLLFVDDVESNLFVLKAYAKKANAEYDLAHNGLEALEMYRKSSDKESEYNYSLIFMDINMPVMDGIEATKRIRKLEEALPDKVKIIGVTANMEATIEYACKEAGMDLVKFKPFSFEAFNEVLHSY